MTFETRIREHLIKEGKNKNEAAWEAFNAVIAILEGSMEPETAISKYGLTIEDYRYLLNWNPKDYLNNK